VTVGVRPEHLVPCDERAATLSGTVEMVENLGADVLIHIGHGASNVIARIPHGAAPAVGSKFSVAADPARVFAFDAATGARLR
jgi:sn-glycerol 3-phosphate transport system ATP-binding protein/multiple sugar transport system ATP-binding protein